LKKQYGLVIDQERCIGCEACSVACKNENNGVQAYIRVATLGAEHKDTPTGTYPNMRMTFLPALCNHCEKPPCADACPPAAITRSETGIVFLDEDTCDGCQNCLDACPYGAIVFNDEKGKAEKCNLCRHRLEQGLEPFCVICCEGQAIHFGDMTVPDGNVAKLLRIGNGFCLRPEAGTKPAVFYCPPKEPRGI